MRIQHNIMAMNAYRNYTNNVSAMKKNLEKLSSGYKINRAGDDAAGLAISEKMRAQITGLKQAQNNAKSGINLVQTAEGAMQEVHDMLNRMVKLADQSANGTYDDKVDRLQLQKEVTQLKDEINRIADSANFNGIKLLDGSLAGGEGGAQVKKIGEQAFTGPTAVAGVAEVDTLTFNAGTLAKGDKVTVSVKYLDQNNSLVSKDYTFIAASSDGSMNYADGKTAGANLGAALQAALEKDGAGDIFAFSDAAAGKLVATANEKGTGKGQLIQANVAVNGNPKADGAALTRTTVGTDEMNGYTFKAFDGAANTKAEDFIFTVNGAKFAFATKGNSGAFDADVNVVTLTSAATPVEADVKEMMLTINRVLGSDVARVDTGTKTQLNFLKDGKGGGLTLQIGDTSDSFNQLTVSVKDMHTNSLGIAGVDISTQEGAQAAVDIIKNAINTVSDVRGTLGATQNRLDHTINNLSVMEENIQDAESTIRDTDVADEMMAYTKNNILIQSAQAMLAQANQVPQGVLQLLQ